MDGYTCLELVLLQNKPTVHALRVHHSDLLVSEVAVAGNNLNLGLHIQWPNNKGRKKNSIALVMLPKRKKKKRKRQKEAELTSPLVD